MMTTTLIQELQLLQNSRANMFKEDMTDRILSTVDTITETVSSSVSKRGQMLLVLERRLSVKLFKKLRRRFFK